MFGMAAQTLEKMKIKNDPELPTSSCSVMEQHEAFDVKLCLPPDRIIVS